MDRKVIGIAAACGLILWLADAALDTLFFQRGTFLDHVVRPTPPHELYVRIVTLGAFVAFGMALGLVLGKSRQTEAAARAAESSLRQHAERLEILRAIDTGVLAARSPDAIAQAVVEQIPRLVPCYRATVTLFDGRGGEVALLASYDDGATEVGAGRRLPLDGSFGDLERLRAGELFEMPDTVAAAALPPLLAQLKAEGLRCSIVVPLVAAGELLGSLNLGSRAPRAFTAADKEIAREVAAPLAIAIQQSRLLEQVRGEATELERRVAERTAELEAFSYSVSHDLRAPLRAIDGFGRALAEERGAQLDAEGQRLLRVIRDSAGRMGQLIDDLLAFSRVGRQPVTPAPVDMTGLFRECFARLQSAEPGRDLRLAVGDLPPARGDVTMLRQAVENLLANAIKFTRTRAAALIEVGALPASDPPAYFVRDNGVGYDPSYAGKLFGVFQRLHSSDDFEGTGVGLAIVRRVVERHGGRIWAESQPERGATFYFTLPAAKEAS